MPQLTLSFRAGSANLEETCILGIIGSELFFQVMSTHLYVKCSSIVSVLHGGICLSGIDVLSRCHGQKSRLSFLALSFRVVFTSSGSDRLSVQHQQEQALL